MLTAGIEETGDVCQVFQVFQLDFNIFKPNQVFYSTTVCRVVL